MTGNQKTGIAILTLILLGFFGYGTYQRTASKLNDFEDFFKKEQLCNQYGTDLLEKTGEKLNEVSYQTHFNRTLKECLVSYAHIEISDGKVYDRRYVIDSLENKEIASYTAINQQSLSGMTVSEYQTKEQELMEE